MTDFAKFEVLETFAVFILSILSLASGVFLILTGDLSEPSTIPIIFFVGGGISLLVSGFVLDMVLSQDSKLSTDVDSNWG